jgi:hypothetical protein
MKNILSKKAMLPILIISIAILFTSCDSFTEVDLPDSQLTADAVFEDRLTANAAMTDIYTKIRDNGLFTGLFTGLSNQLGLYSDELTSYYNPGSLSFNYGTNALQASGTEIAQLWNSSYSQIYAANAVIEGVDHSVSLPETDRDQLKGEALFVRALIHFYLVNSFGGVPYISTTNYAANRIAHRTAENDALLLVKSDLEQAIALLPDSYISSERVRPNRYAAYAMLARVNLYLHLWDQASNAASAVLNQTDVYVWENDLDKVFLKESTTTIWQLMPAMMGDNTKEAKTFVFFSGPPPSSSLSPTILTAFESNDQRKVHWTKMITTGVNSWSHAYKYKEFSNAGSSVEYSIVLRLAEQYLIRAEARAQQGDLIGAKEDLNKIRNTAGLGDTPATTSAEIITAVLKERQTELFCEFGHRFFDLKRNGLLDTALSPMKLGWNTTDRLLPLPQKELLLNPNLAPQNDGY